MHFFIQSIEFNRENQWILCQVIRKFKPMSSRITGPRHRSRWVKKTKVKRLQKKYICQEWPQPDYYPAISRARNF